MIQDVTAKDSASADCQCWWKGLSTHTSAFSFLVLRLFIAYEFLESGMQKLHGDNWFAEIQDKFPFPFSLLPVDVDWYLAMTTELVAPVLLVLGLATRLSALSCMILTVVAWQAVHAGLGYNVGGGGYKMSVIYLVVLLPLLTQGAGKWSLDAILSKWAKKKRFLL